MDAELAVGCWERARVDAAADFNPSSGPPVRAVFGYGSLIWKPGFPYCREQPACVRGFARRFWQRSSDHRGTPESPGRVLTLIRPEELAPAGGQGDVESAEVSGIAYEVADAHWEEVLALLDFRERHGYTRTVANLFEPSLGPARGARAAAGSGREGAPLGRAVVYYVQDPCKSVSFCGPEDIEETASVIASAAGPSGRNDEYLFNLQRALHERRLPDDPYLTSLAHAVRRRQRTIRRGQAWRGITAACLGFLAKRPCFPAIGSTTPRGLAGSSGCRVRRLQRQQAAAVRVPRWTTPLVSVTGALAWGPGMP